MVDSLQPGKLFLHQGAHLGLLYHDNLAAPLEPGQTVKGFVRLINANGKIDLRLDAAGYKRVLPLKSLIVKALEENGDWVMIHRERTADVYKGA